MLRLRPLLFAPLALMFATAQGNAAVLFHADLTGAQETPPVATSAFGFADFVLNDAATALSMTITIFGIDVTGTQSAAMDDDLLAAHIHAPSALGSGMTAGVVWGFFGAPDNDINPSDLVVTPFGTGLGGVFTTVWNQGEGNGTNTLTSQLPNLLNNLAYINFHTREFGGGEIRGQILTPEPTSLILLATGLVALARARRKVS